MSKDIPGWGGSLGPSPSQYNQPHVYARDIQSGAGNCVCGSGLGENVHIQAAPGVPVPDNRRPFGADCDILKLLDSMYVIARELHSSGVVGVTCGTTSTGDINNPLLVGLSLTIDSEIADRLIALKRMGGR